jgi:hypothetical protein
VHKTALGAALGVVCGLAVFALTAFHITIESADSLDIGLLARYFYRCEVS